jgi:dihydroorotase
LRQVYMSSRRLMTDGEPESQHLTRRDLLSGMTGSLVAAALPFGKEVTQPSLQGSNEKEYDLLIQGGKVIDPSQGIETVLDVAIRGKEVVRLEKNIPPNSARQILNATGNFVTPGLIDIHGHVFPYMGSIGVEPDPYCIQRGVTTIVDAGSAGALNFEAFRHFVIDHAETRIRALLNISALGIIAAGEPLHVGELIDLRYCDSAFAVKVAEENKELILGFKIRPGRTMAGPGTNGMEAMKMIRKAADEARLPIMLHIGDSVAPLSELLAFARPGDIVTHVYNPKSNTLLDSNGKLQPAVSEARQRGVLFDLGPGKPSFSFAVAERCLDQGFLVDTISSDINTLTLGEHPPNDLTTAATKMLVLGMNLNDVIARMTTNSAKALPFGAKLGTLEPGAEADIAILNLQEGDFVFTDGEGKSRKSRQMLHSIATVRGQQIFYSGNR